MYYSNESNIKSISLLSTSSNKNTKEYIDAKTNFDILSQKNNISYITQIPKDKIFLVQISDAPFLDLDYLSWSRSQRILPGYGEFNLKEFVKVIKSTGFNEYFSLECFNKDLQTRDLSNVAKEGFGLNQKLWNIT